MQAGNCGFAGAAAQGGQLDIFSSNLGATSQAMHSGFNNGAGWQTSVTTERVTQVTSYRGYCRAHRRTSSGSFTAFNTQRRQLNCSFYRCAPCSHTEELR